METLKALFARDAGIAPCVSEVLLARTSYDQKIPEDGKVRVAIGSEEMTEVDGETLYAARESCLRKAMGVDVSLIQAVPTVSVSAKFPRNGGPPSSQNS